MVAIHALVGEAAVAHGSGLVIRVVNQHQT